MVKIVEQKEKIITIERKKFNQSCNSDYNRFSWATWSDRPFRHIVPIIIDNKKIPEDKEG